MSLLIKFNATKIPKKKDDIKFTIEVLCILKLLIILKLFCIYILVINPKALPNKIMAIDNISKIYIKFRYYIMIKCLVEISFMFFSSQDAVCNLLYVIS